MPVNNVLLIDDEPNVLSGLCRNLRHQPYEVFTARSAEEALPIVKSRPIAVVVSDEQMPGRSGTELFSWMATACPEIVRIVLTGHSSPETTMRAINKGKVFRYFTKPCHVVELALAIRDGIDQFNASRSEPLEELAV